MKTGLLSVMVMVMVMATGAAWADDEPRVFHWDEVFAEGKLPAGAELVAGDEGAVLKVTGTAGTPVTVSVLTIDDLGITSERYGLEGQVRYQGVEGEGYLEMWNVFPDGSRYFSRTMSPSGPMGKLAGDAEWRTFLLPFDRTGSAAAPERLEVNVVLPSSGEVELGPVTLKAITGLPMGGMFLASRVWLMVAVLCAILVPVFWVRVQRHKKSHDESPEARRMKAMDA